MSGLGSAHFVPVSLKTEKFFLNVFHAFVAFHFSDKDDYDSAELPQHAQILLAGFSALSDLLSACTQAHVAHKALPYFCALVIFPLSLFIIVCAIGWCCCGYNRGNMNSFGHRSRVIATTRDDDILVYKKLTMCHARRNSGGFAERLSRIECLPMLENNRIMIICVAR